MAKSNFGPVLDQIYKHEGGYVDHPNDPGGATNLGITHKTLAAWRGVSSVSKTAVKNINRTETDAIYRARYWDTVKGDNLPYGLDLVAMDGAVNSGPRRGVKWLQQGVGVRADGVVGPNTIDAARKSDATAIERACDARMSFLRGLKHWGTFARGWSRRVADVEAVGVRMFVSAAEGKPAARKALTERIEAAPGRAQDERRAGGAQASATGAGGAGGATVADLPPAAIVVLALGAVIVAALLIWRAQRKARYHEDRRDAFAAELEHMK